MIETLLLPGSNTQTSRLGFGCSGLMTSTGRRQSLALLEAAFDSGIRHFDVAPSYGFGEAESCVGEFLSRHRGAVTVATKFGLSGARSPGLVRLARRLAGPLVQRLPGLKRRLAPRAESLAHAGRSVRLTAAAARESLDKSLRALQTERLDLWLLHEATAEGLKDDGLLRMLQDAVQQGKVGAFGVGGEAEHVPGLLQRCREFCPVLQFEWSVLQPAIAAEMPPWSGISRMHHRALTPRFRELHAKLQADGEKASRWSQLTGQDVCQPETLSGLMLCAALELNPGCGLLFSSKQPKHIQGNVRAADDATLREASRQFYRLVQAEGF